MFGLRISLDTVSQSSSCKYVLLSQAQSYSGNWNSRKKGTEVEMESRNRNFYNPYYSSDSSPVRFTD